MFKGRVEIQVKDKKTEEIKRVIEKENSMTLLALKNLFYQDSISWRSSTGTSNLFSTNTGGTLVGGSNRDGSIDSLTAGYITVGRVDPQTIINEATMNINNCTKTGDYVRSFVIPGENQPIASTDFDNKTVEYTFKGRVEPPTSPTREINLVHTGYITDNRPNARGIPGFAVVLDNPCIQTDEEILDVFYRVSVTSTDKNPEDILWKTMYQSRLFPFYYTDFIDGSFVGSNSISRNYGVRDLLYRGYKLAPERKVIRTRIDNGGDNSSTETSNKNFSQLTGVYSLSYGLSDDIGNTYSSVYAFTNRSPFGNYFSLSSDNRANRSFSQQVFPQDINPVQSVFKHSPNAIRPYLDPSFIGASTSDVILDGTNFELDTSMVYKIVYTTGGVLGDAQYKVEKKVTLGYPGEEYFNEYQSSKPIMTLPGHEVLSTNSYRERSEVAQPDDGIVASGEDLLHYKRGLNEWIMFPTMQRYDENHIICADAYGISILNVYTDDYVNYDEFSDIVFNVTGLNDYCVDNDKTIWLASKNEGLYKLNYETSTLDKISFNITGVDDNICYTVDYKNNGDVWAVFSGGLLRTQDGGITWELFDENSTPQFQVPNITNGNWQDIQGIVLDKESADDRLLLVLKTSENIGWWSRAGSTTSSDYLDSGVGVDVDSADNLGYIRNYTNSFSVRKWIKHFPGTNSFVLLNNRNSTIGLDGAALRTTVKTIDFMGTSLRASETTNTRPERLKVKYIHFENDSVGIPRLVLVRVSSTSNDAPVEHYLRDENLTQVQQLSNFLTDGGLVNLTNINTTSYNTAYIENMGGGIALLARLGLCYLHHTITNEYPDGGDVKHITWQSYGWNGTSWEKDHTGSKPTHNTVDPLIDGLTIAFEEGGTPQFVENEYVTAYVFRGVHKDNATSLSFNFAYHLRPTENLQDLSTSTVPLTPKGLVENKQLNFNTHTTDSTTGTELYQVTGLAGRASYVNNTLWLYSELKFEGDFSVSFKTSKSGTNDGNARATFSITPVSTLSSVSTWVDPQYIWWFDRFNLQGFTGNALTGSTVSVYPNTDTWVGDEVFTLERVGTTIRYKIDGTVVHEATGASTEAMVAVVAFRSEDFRTFYDMNIDYFTENRRVIELGDSIEGTGVFDPQFAMVESWLTPKTCKVTIDGQETPLIVETLDDPLTGQATLLPKTGWLVFDDADGGLDVTAEYQAMFRILPP